MKAASVHQLKQELIHQSPKDLVNLCLRLAKFKKENKELLSYLLFESHDEESFISGIKTEISAQFENINRRNYYYIKKSIRKILKEVRKHIRYSKKKETEVELMLFFLQEMKEFHPSIRHNIALRNLYNRQIETLKKTISILDEDLQYDYGLELDDLLQK